VSRPLPLPTGLPWDWTGPITLIGLFLVSHCNFLFVPCGGLSWLPVSFLLHVKYTRIVSYRIVTSEVVSTFSRNPYKLATKSNATACRGRQLDILNKVERVQLGRHRKWVIFVARLSNVLSTFGRHSVDFVEFDKIDHVEFDFVVNVSCPIKTLSCRAYSI